jgi:assimilatory nitrate reductase catalytic subunit
MTDSGPCHAVYVGRALPDVGPGARLACRAIEGGWLADIAWPRPPEPDRLAARVLGADTADPTTVFLDHEDLANGIYRAAHFRADMLAAALFVDRSPPAVDRVWLAARLGTPLDPAERFRLLDGRPGGFLRPRGPTVCFCRDVGSEEIAEAIRAGAKTVPDIGSATTAGTACGGCRPTLARLVQEVAGAGGSSRAP